MLAMTHRHALHFHAFRSHSGERCTEEVEEVFYGYDDFDVILI